jgi:hypothetical protein
MTRILLLRIFAAAGTRSSVHFIQISSQFALKGGYLHSRETYAL